jgi:hypothetical protein
MHLELPARAGVPRPGPAQIAQEATRESVLWQKINHTAGLPQMGRIGSRPLAVRATLVQLWKNIFGWLETAVGAEAADAGVAAGSAEPARIDPATPSVRIAEMRTRLMPMISLHGIFTGQPLAALAHRPAGSAKSSVSYYQCSAFMTRLSPYVGIFNNKKIHWIFY